MMATMDRPSQQFGFDRISGYEPAALQAVGKLMTAVTRKPGERPSLTVVTSAHTWRHPAVAAYLGAVHHSLMTIPTGVSVSAFRKAVLAEVNGSSVSGAGS